MRLVIVAASLLLLAGSGGGLTFLLTSVDVDGAPRRLDAGDVDGDGDIDLFVLAGIGTDPSASASFQVLVNQGGNFGPGWTGLQLSTDSFPGDVHLADADGDGDPDAFLVTHFPMVRFNDGNGNFPTYASLQSFSQRDDQEPADTDGNGDIDVDYFEADVIGYFGTQKGAGDGTFDYDLSTEVMISGFPDHERRFVVGDITGDGRPDAAMASKNGLEFIRGKPPMFGSTLPGYLPAQKVYPTPCFEPVLVDLSGDGRPDIVASVPSLDSVVVLITRASGQPGLPRLYAAGESPGAIAATDFDLDGKADVIVANPTTKSVTVLRGTGSGGLLGPGAFTVGRRPTDIVTADFDDDGDDDVAVTCANDSNVALLFNETL